MRPNLPSFGFSSRDGKIDNKFPDGICRLKKLEDCRWWFRQENATVIKIAEQICL